MKGLVIWAHSKCRSTFDLYREVMRQSPLPVRLVFWKDVLESRIEQGFSSTVFDAIPSVVIGDDLVAADRILDETVGCVHVVAAYQVAEVMQHVMWIAKVRGDRVVVYSEAPCEMCLGMKGLVKRLYYRFVLPRRIRPVVACADLILSQSGVMGIDRLERLGWSREKIVPFGYASPKLSFEENDSRPQSSTSTSLHVLHLGSESAYRGVDILEKAVRLAQRQGAMIELSKSGGALPISGLVAAIRAADIVVGCGLCEPWGMRINDAVLEGKPVIVSDGMGVAYMVEQEGCGLVVPRGDPVALAKALERCAKDREFVKRLASGAQRAAQRWSPESRAADFLRVVLGGDTRQ